MKMIQNILATLSLIVAGVSEARAAEVFMLTQSLQLSSSEDLQSPENYNVSAQPTLLKRISSGKGVTKVQLVQVNGQPSDKIAYVSSKWFTNGTRVNAIDPFLIDPNKVIGSNLSAKSPADCAPDAGRPVEPAKPTQPVNPYVQDACHILKGEPNNFTNKQKEDLHMACFDNIKKKLKVNYVENSYSAMSKLYSLPKEQQVFMARLLTMYGEASGAVPAAEQMAAVLQIIDNRTRVAQRRYPNTNQLDVVLQNAQFSMYNPSDSNWRRALFASKQQLRTAMHVIANRDDYDVIQPPLTGKRRIPTNVFHYMTYELCGSAAHPAWAGDCQRNSTPITVNRTKLTATNGHVFFSNVSWRFNPINRYKAYARRLGIIK